jgi:lipopolysaccharide export system permease protein
VIRIIDRYVLKQIATPLMAAISIGMLMLLAERMVRLLDTTLGKKNSLTMVFEMLAYLVPHYLGTAMPAALFLGLLFGFSKMSKNSEIDAFMAAGIGLHRLVRPVLVLSLLFLLISLWVFGWVQPFARYAYRAVVFEVQNVQIFYLAEEGVFMQADTRTFILDKLDRGTNAFEHVFIFNDDPKNGTETVTAIKGSLVEVPGEPRPVLHLENGHRMIFADPPQPGKPAPRPPRLTTFAAADSPIGKVAPDLFRDRGIDERELTLPELIAKFTKPPPGATRRSMRAELNKRLIYILTLPILPYLAVPFAVGHRRSQRSFRFGAALVLIIAYHEIVEQGSLAVKTSGISPLTAIWLPWGLLVGFTAWRFYVTSFTVGNDPLENLIERVSDLATALRSRIFGARKNGAPT